MSDTFAIQYVLNGLQADIARRDTLIRDHVAAAARLEADNATDARHAEVAAALIEQINADALAVAWAPTTEIDAATLVADNAAIGGLPRFGKSAAMMPMLVAALRDAATDITAVDGKAAARLVHDHHPDAEPCPACLLAGAGDLAELDGIDAGAGVAR